MLAEALSINEERALGLFYSTKTYKQLSDSGSGIQLMSDEYILENILNELRGVEYSFFQYFYRHAHTL